MNIQNSLNIGIRKYDELRNEKYKNRPKGRQYFYVSDALKCKRMLYFEFQEDIEPEKLSVDLLGRFNYGNEAQDRIRNYMRLGGIYVEDEISLPSNKLNIHGRCDGILTEKGNDEKSIVEIKTINLREVKQPMKEHIAQLQLYLHFLKVEKGVLLYESKHTNIFYDFPIKYDLIQTNEILHYFETVAIHLKNKDIPLVNQDYVEDKYPCNFCTYIEHCYGENKK